VDRCRLGFDDLVADVGAGASGFLEALLRRGFRSLIAVDLSPTALDRSRSSLKDEEAARIRWMVDDITSSDELIHVSDVRLWHDRAVLHFLTAERDQQAYHDVLSKTIGPSGYVIIAAFSKQGARMCSGLPVVNYDAESLAQFLGPRFELIESFDHIHFMPSGDERPYVYTLFREQEG
jgi:hypothetical protein